MALFQELSVLTCGLTKRLIPFIKQGSFRQSTEQFRTVQVPMPTENIQTGGGGVVVVGCKAAAWAPCLSAENTR